MRRFVPPNLARAALLSVLVSSAGCSFILDFEELEGVEPSTLDCQGCEERDPCTPDRCTDNGCVPAPEDDPLCTGPDAGSFVCGAQVGLISATQFEPLEADKIERTQVLFTTDALYHVAHIMADEQSDVIVRAFKPGDDAPSAMLKLSEATVDGEVVAGPAVLVRSSSNAALTLYVTLKQPGAALGHVKRLTVSSDLIPDTFISLAEIPNYFTTQVGPAAGLLVDGTPFVVWHGCRGPESSVSVTTPCPSQGAALFAHSGTSTLSTSALLSGGLSENAALQGLVALGGGQQPAAAWLTSNTEQDAEPSIDVRMGVPATGAKNDVRLCHTEGGYLGHALNSTQLVRERSSISWSKVSGSTFVTEATAVSCRSDGCTDVAGAPDAGTCTEAQRERRVLPGVQRLAQGALSSSNALDGYVVSAWSETSNSGASSVWVQMHEGNSNPNETAPLSEAWLSREDVTLGTNPADSPIVSVLDAAGGANQTEIVAVGWTQSAAEPARQLAHLRSFHLCPQP